MSEKGLIYAVVVKMLAEHAGNLDATHGNQAYAAFLNMVQSTAPEVSEALHAEHQYKPFSVSPLMGLNAPEGGRAHVGEGQEVWFRFTLLESTLFAPLAAYFLRGGRATVRIGGVHFQVLEMLSTPGSHPRAGYTTIEEIWARWHDRDDLPDTVTLQFLTPTAIRVGTWPSGAKRFLLWPEPERVWYGLRRVWGEYGGWDPGKTYNSWVEEHTGTVAHDVKTRMLKFPRHLQAGFEGRASFRAEGRDHDKLALWHALADFAFFAGVGYKTTMGMGQAERVDG